VSTFWKIVSLLLFFLFVPGLYFGWLLDSRPRLRGWEPNLPLRLYLIAWGCGVITVVWAICFRPQVEKRKFSLFAIATLVAMAAVFLAWLRIVRPI
jgi:hypothetical protein